MIVTSFFLLIFLPNFTKAQDENNLKFLFPFELQIGINHLAKSESFHPKMGYGLSFKKFLFTKDHFALLSGFRMDVIKFEKRKIRTGRYTVYKDLKFNKYGISFPLLARGIIGKKIPLFLEGGLSFVIIPTLRGEGKKTVDLPLEPKVTQNVSEKFKPAYSPDFSGIVGIGTRFPLGEMRGVFTISFHKSFLRSRKNSGPKTHQFFSGILGLFFQ